MATITRILAFLCFLVAALAMFLGLASLPAGGLMFALPFVFFGLGLILALLGGGLLLLARALARRGASR